MSYGNTSFAFGIAQLMWGVAQPTAGVVADRWGPRSAMIAGVVHQFIWEALAMPVAALARLVDQPKANRSRIT